MRPDYLPALNNLAMVLADRSCHGEALDTIDRAIRMSGTDATLGKTLEQSRSEILAAQQGRTAVSGCGD